MASEIRVNTINSRTGLGTITVSETGQDLAGISTIANLYVPEYITHKGDTNTKFGFNNPDTVSVHTNGSERVRVTSAGKVGIGDADPDEALHVYATGAGIKVDSNGDSAVRWATSGTNKYSLYHNNGANALVFYDNGNSAERVRIDSSGRLLIGTTDIDSVSDGEVPKLISKGPDSTAGAAFVRHSANAGGCGIYLAKSRNATIGSKTIVQSGDELGRITFSGDDGTNLNTQGAQIAAHVDGTPGENDMPGRLQFYTTADGAATVTERMRITSSGQLLAGTTSARTNFRNGATGNSATPQYQCDTANDDALNDISLTYGRNNAYGAEIIFAKHRAATVGGTSAAQNNDRLGGISFNGSDGTNFQPAAFIEGEVDGTPGTDDMPGRLVFCTTADGEKVPTERVRIYQNGIPQITNAGESLFGTGVTAINIGNGVNVSMADDASFTASSACNTGALISVGTTKDSSGNIRYRHGLFFAQYGSTSVTEISDTENTFATSDSDGYVCVYATSSVNGNVVIKNRLGHTSNICVTIVRFLGN